MSLCGPLHTLTEFVNQLAPRQETVTNKAILQAVTDLYIDPPTKQPKYRARSKGPGGPCRMAAVLNQLDVTWDLYSVTTDSFPAVCRRNSIASGRIGSPEPFAGYPMRRPESRQLPFAVLGPVTSWLSPSTCIASSDSGNATPAIRSFASWPGD